MFVEVRKERRKKKYYLAHSYREGKKVKRIIKYLGSDLSENETEKLRKKAEQLILEQIKEKNIFEFELSKKEIERYRKYEKEIKIAHLQSLDWLAFTESFTYNTNAIEGSAVSKHEVKELVEKEENPVNFDEIETVNAAKAVEFIRSTKENLSIDLINKIHLICFKGTKPFAGKLRDVGVVIRDSRGNIVHRGAFSKNVRKLLANLCNWYEKHKNKYPPLLLAALVHNQFEDIHPYQDGNGRVGRLLLNYALLKCNYPPININLRDRKRYYLCLQKFHKLNDIESSLKFLIDQYKKQFR